MDDYIAKQGENLYLIARRLGMEVRQLAQANPEVRNVYDDLGDHRVVFPQGICPNGFLYTIQPGDTYFLLAQRYNTTVAAIAQANPGADPNNLRVGQVICIPQTPAPPTCPNGTLYTIRAGDTYYTLAQRFGTTVGAIEQANPGVNPNNLQIGQVICIPHGAPPPACSGFLYTIQPGDTYYHLAQRFGTTVGAIEQANPGVNPNNLQVGQVICIPQGVAPICSGFYYTIQPGDTYYHLAQRFGTTVRAIEQANPGVNPNNLQIGQSICIPV